MYRPAALPAAWGPRPAMVMGVLVTISAGESSCRASVCVAVCAGRCGGGSGGGWGLISGEGFAFSLELESDPWHAG